VTFAEIPPDPKIMAGALPHMLRTGSLVFTPPARIVDLRDTRSRSIHQQVTSDSDVSFEPGEKHEH
jgi:hypothetical protein